MRRKLKTVEEAQEAPNQGSTRQYRNRLEFFVTCYTKETDYIQRMKNRFQAIAKNTALGDWEMLRDEMILLYVDPAEDRKTKAEKLIHNELKTYPDYKWMKTFPGMGDVNAGYFLANLDIDQSDTFASFLRFCGLGLSPAGDIQKSVKGQKRDYCSRLKAVLLQSIGSMTLLRHTDSVAQYRAIYDEWKAIYGAKPACGRSYCKGEFCTKMHVHRRALRKMIEAYCLVLWLRWRTEHGLSTPGFENSTNTNDSNTIHEAATHEESNIYHEAVLV